MRFRALRPRSSPCSAWTLPIIFWYNAGIAGVGHFFRSFAVHTIIACLWQELIERVRTVSTSFAYSSKIFIDHGAGDMVLTKW